MKTLRTFALAAVASLAVLSLTHATAHAERGITPFRPAYAYVNPNPYIAPGLTLRQYAYNTAVLGQAYSTIPPYALGYNPYPQVINYGPVYRTPYAYNPYAPYTYGYSSPYSAYTGYYGTYNPYYP